MLVCSAKGKAIDSIIYFKYNHTHISVTETAVQFRQGCWHMSIGGRFCEVFD